MIKPASVKLSALSPLGSNTWLTLAFLLGLGLRTMPELIAGPNGVIGYDLVAYYAPLLSHKSAILSNWRLLFALPYETPLPYVALLWVPPGLVIPALRVVAVMCYGFLAAAIYLFTKERMGLEPKWAFFASVFLCIQLATLRIGYDLLRNSLALIFALVILSGRFRQSSPTVRLLSAAVALTHELVAVILAGIWGMQLLLERREPNSEKYAIAENLALVIGLTILGPIIGDDLNAYPASGRVYFLPFGAIGTLTQPMVNYLMGYPYAQIASIVLQLTLFLLYPLLLLVAWFGLKKDSVLLGWVLVTSLAGFSPIFLPTYAAGLWYRWLLMLVFPLGIYAVLGIRKLVRRFNNFKPKVGILFLLLTLTPFLFLAGNFLLVPPEHAIPYFTNHAVLPEFPSSMLQNTVPLGDVAEVQRAVNVLNSTMTSDSVVLVHESFFGWASMGLTGNKTIIDYLLGIPIDALPMAKRLGFKTIYWLAWAPGVSWNNYQAPTNIFKPIYTSGEISVYIYVGP